MAIHGRFRQGRRQEGKVESAMSQLHPAVVFGYYGCSAAVCMLFLHPVFLLAALGLLLVQIAACGAGKALRQWLLLYVITGLTILIINPLFSHRGEHILFYLGDNPIVLEAIVYGFVMMLSVLSMLLVVLVYQQVMATDRWLYLFGRVAPKAALIVAMALRFVPLFRRRLKQIGDVQRTKGLGIGTGSLVKRIGNGLQQVRLLTIVSLEDAMQTADSMNARGYGTQRRTSFRQFRFQFEDWFMISIGVILIAFCVYGWGLGHGIMNIYPHLGEWRISNALDVTVFVAFCAWFMIPLAVEGKERWRWRIRSWN